MRLSPSRWTAENTGVIVLQSNQNWIGSLSRQMFTILYFYASTKSISLIPCLQKYMCKWLIDVQFKQNVLEKAKSELEVENFHQRRWGSLLPGLLMLDPPLSPPSTLVEIFGARLWEGGSIFSPFQAILSTFLFFKKNLKKSSPRGAGGSPNFCFTPNLIFL